MFIALSAHELGSLGAVSQSVRHRLSVPALDPRLKILFEALDPRLKILFEALDPRRDISCPHADVDQ